MQTITVPIGATATIDGGPFFNFAGNGSIHDDEIEGEDGRTVSVGCIEDCVTDEMLSSEPVKVNTGDVKDVDGTLYRIGEIELPLVRGYLVEIHALPGQGNDIVADLGNLADDELRRRHFEKKLISHGGTISG